jgi:hypothetical protein
VLSYYFFPNIHPNNPAAQADGRNQKAVRKVRLTKTN